MALIKCPECGRDNVSNKAEACPNCGYPISKVYDVTYSNNNIHLQKMTNNISQQSIDKTNLVENENFIDNNLTWDQKYNKKPQNHNNKMLIIFIISGCCLFSIVYLYYINTRCIVASCTNKKMSSSEYCVNHYLKTINNNMGDDDYEYSSYSTSAVNTGTMGALNKAKSYLNSSAFSYSGLINQLEYEGFTESEAKYGADNCGADWNEQAEKKAESYLSSSSFSYSGLIEQLEYEGFTESEVKYGVDNCGADWYEQAIKKANSYRKSSHLSGDELREQLVYEGFTFDQAEYGVNNSN